MPDKQKWSLQNISFKWRGRTKEGVSKWWGAPKGPPEWFGRIFCGYGILAGLGGLSVLLFQLLAGSGANPGLWVLSLVGFSHALVFGLIGRWALHMRHKISRLKSAEELAQEFGSSPEIVRRLAEEHEIRPRINLNDTDLYNPQEFYASQILLRAASAPIAPETLLRPAEPSTPQTAPETLLRPIEPEMDTKLQTSLPAEQINPDLDWIGDYAEKQEEAQNSVQELHP